MLCTLTFITFSLFCSTIIVSGNNFQEKKQLKYLSWRFYKFIQDYSSHYINTVRPVIFENWHLTHLYDRIISLRGVVWAHKTISTFIAVPVYQARKVNHLCIRGIDLAFLNVFYWIWELFKQLIKLWLFIIFTDMI